MPTSPLRPQRPREKQDVDEYACHEGNRGLEGIMTGSRLQDRLKAGTKP